MYNFRIPNFRRLFPSSRFCSFQIVGLGYYGELLYTVLKTVFIGRRLIATDYQHIYHLYPEQQCTYQFTRGRRNQSWCTTALLLR